MIGSEVMEKGTPEFSNYVAAKGAQLGLTRSWAMELAPHGITVNLVAPGWIPTERHENDPQEAKETLRVREFLAKNLATFLDAARKRDPVSAS